MATFGSIASPAPNVLYNPMAVDQAVMQQQRNQLLMENARQDQAFQAEDRQINAGERDHAEVARISAVLMGAPEAQRAELYPKMVGEAQQRGLLRSAPTAYPGHEVIAAKAQSGLTPAQIFARQDLLADRTALGARYPLPGGGTAPASVPSVPGAAPAAGGGQAPAGGGVRPFVAQNLPQGVDPETDQIVRTVIGEAGGEDDRGQQAVGAVILNRAKQSGMDTAGVIFAPNQFEPWNNPQTRAKLEAIDPASPQYQRALANLQRVRSGLEPDPTGGATHFYSPTAQTALGRPAPSWDNGKGVDLGRHRFFNLGYAPGSGAPGAPPGQQQAGTPTPEPTPPGGVAARTGGTDTAGPGAGPAVPQIGPSGFTAQQERALAERARSRGTTQQQMDALEHTFRTENAAALRHREAMDLRRAEHPPADPTAAFGGTGIDAQANNILLRVGPKIANGTASDAERQQYELAHGHITRGSVQPVPDPSDPTGQRMMLGRVPGQVPGSFPAPDFRPAAPGAEPAAAAAPAGAQPIPGTAKPVPVKEVPAKVADGMLENVGAVRKIDDALLELTTRKDSGVGFVVGNLPTAITSRTDPGGVRLRALIADIGSLKLHDRSGANVTASESPRLLPFIPLTSDDADTVRTKLQNFRREYTTALRDQYETYGPTTGHKPMAPVERLLEGAGADTRGGDKPDKAQTGGGWSIRPKS